MVSAQEIHTAEAVISARHHGGIGDLVEVAKERLAAGSDSMGNASITGSLEFTHTRDLAQAIDLAEHGWQEGTDRVASIANTLSVDDHLLRSAVRQETRFDVGGDEPDIERFLLGDPEHMVTFVPAESTHGKILNLVVNISQSYRVEASRIEHRGAAILAAVDALRTNGYSVGVTAVEEVGGYRYNSKARLFRSETPLLEPGQFVDVDALAFSLVHPSFLRRLLFAACEAESREVRNEFGFKHGGGYGSPESLQHYMPEHPAVIIESEEGLEANEETASTFAQQVIEKSLAALEPER